MTLPLALNLPPIVRKSATFSPCARWRYTLTREWDGHAPRVTFVMLNPSTADAEKDDPTVAKCQVYARRWGFGALTVVNIFAWRSTNPKVLPSIANPIGPDNDAAIEAAVCSSKKVICAWGKHGGLLDRGKQVLANLRALGITPYALSRNNDGSPAHPLYLPAANVPQVMT